MIKSISQSWITIVIQGGTSVAVNGPNDSLLIGSFNFWVVSTDSFNIFPIHKCFI